jgi:hypothetical protein
MKHNKKHPLTVFREANEARAKLVKKSMGGPGSGMGSMYLADQEFDAMMNTPSKPAISNASVLDPRKIALMASEAANKDLSNRPTNVELFNKIQNQKPGLTREEINSYMNPPKSPAGAPRPPQRKKGGSVKRKKR